jgi:hypothetical protein
MGNIWELIYDPFNGDELVLFFSRLFTSDVTLARTWVPSALVCVGHRETYREDTHAISVGDELVIGERLQ